MTVFYYSKSKCFPVLNCPESTMVMDVKGKNHEAVKDDTRV